MPMRFTRTLAGGAFALSGAFALAADDSASRAVAGVMTAYVKEGEPGCTVGVLRNGAMVHAAAFGLADLEKKKPLDTHSIFNLASVSKQFTTFALLLLQQDGKLKLDDPVAKYVPEIARSSGGVTLRHLVHHTGGLRDYIELLTMKERGDADGATIHETVQALGRQTAPNEKPGVEWDYSNTGYFLLGVVVARVSGQSLAQFSKERIFEPLAMKNTSIVDRYPDGIAALARGYRREDRGFVIDETGWEQVGDGQVHSDLHDLALWDENFYTAKVGGRAVIDEMYQVGRLNSGESTGYGGGLSIAESRGLTWVSHGGSWVGYRSNISRVPSEHFSVIVLCNRAEADTGDLASSVAEIYLKDKIGPPEPEEPETEEAPVAAEWKPGALSRYAGAYFSEEADARCVIDERGNKLVLETCAEGLVLKPAKSNEFDAAGSSLKLRFEPGAGEAEGFVYWSPGLRGIPFKRIKESFE
ncbi:MAG TPA: serine hydrolase domain-containing protein [Steroidobacteraceae bacterium]|nr:serine hydrolase domain-containing protein [Steroidobacteraceae bacterium]